MNLERGVMEMQMLFSRVIINLSLSLLLFA